MTDDDIVWGDDDTGPDAAVDGRDDGQRDDRDPDDDRDRELEERERNLRARERELRERELAERERTLNEREAAQVAPVTAPAAGDPRQADATPVDDRPTGTPVLDLVIIACLMLLIGGAIGFFATPLLFEHDDTTDRSVEFTIPPPAG